MTTDPVGSPDDADAGDEHAATRSRTRRVPIAGAAVAGVAVAGAASAGTLSRRGDGRW
jgi:hypothetical protein